MNLISNFVAAMALSQLWGSVSYGLWRHVVRKYGGRFHTMSLFCMLWVVVLMFFAAGGFRLAVFMGHWYLDARLFLASPVMNCIFVVLFSLWIAGCMYNARYVVRDIKWAKMLAKCAKVPGQKQWAEYCRICRKYGIRLARARIYLSEDIESGRIVGVFFPSILLPAGKMTDTELEITLVHELMHYRGKDMWLKCAAMAVGVMGWFNPAAKCLLKDADLWCEYACDCRTLAYIGNAHTYMGTIVDIAERYTDERLAGLGISSSRDKKENQLKKRVERLILMEKRKKLGVKEAAALAGLFMTCTAGLFAVTAVAAEAYEAVYDATADEIILNTIDEAYGEVIVPVAYDQLPDNSDIDPADYVNTGIVFRDVLPCENSGLDGGILTKGIKTGSIDWDLEEEAMATSSGFSVTKGDRVAVSGTVSPSSSVIRVGLILPVGTKVCTYVTGDFAKVFSTYSAGTYRVYAINDNAYGVHVDGVFAVYATE